jgi:hypothetical protein
MNSARFWDATPCILVEVLGVSDELTATMFRVEEKHKEAIRDRQQFDWLGSMNATNAGGHTAVTHACNWSLGLCSFVCAWSQTRNLVGILFRYVSQRIIFKIRRNLMKAHRTRERDQVIRTVVCPTKSLLLEK